MLYQNVARGGFTMIYFPLFFPYQSFLIIFSDRHKTSLFLVMIQQDLIDPQFHPCLIMGYVTTDVVTASTSCLGLINAINRGSLITF